MRNLWGFFFTCRRFRHLVARIKEYFVFPLRSVLRCFRVRCTRRMGLVFGSERGETTLELLLIMVVFIIPLVSLMVFLAQLHMVALASEAGVRASASVLARGGSQSQARAAAQLAFIDYGLPAPKIGITCENGCGPGGREFSVRLHSQVVPQLVPGIFNLPLAVPVSSTGAGMVDSFIDSGDVK